jgi:hypothetical protein
MADEDYNFDYSGESGGGDTLTEEQKAALLAQQGQMQGPPPPPPQPGPGVPMAPPPPPVQSAPYDPGQAYDQAAQSGPGPAASAAWGQLAATGATSNPARVYPPVQPGMTSSRQLKGAPFQVTEPGDQAIRLAENMGVPLQQAIQAIDAQQRYQAQRGYQADLDRGVSAEDAAVKWFPLMMGSTTTKGFGLPQPAKPPQSRNIAGRLYERNPASGQWEAVTAPKVNTPRATKAVNDTYTALKSAELIAQQENEPRKMRDAMKATAEFVSQHPELGLSPGGQQAATTATGTTPGPVVPPAPLPRNRIYMGPNIQGANQSDAQFMGDIPTGARAGVMNRETSRPLPRPTAAPMAAPSPMAASVAASRVSPPHDEQADFPPAPATPAQRKAGQTYSTPKGNFTWTGSNWKKAAE